MRRNKQMKIWVSENELKAIDASEVNGISRAEYIRSGSVGRPVEASNRLFRAERQLERQKLHEAAEEAQREEAAEDARIAQEAAVLNPAQKEAERLAAASAGTPR